MKIVKFVPKEFSANNYLLINEQTNNAALFDPSGCFSEIDGYINKNNINLKYIIVTHMHFDHVGDISKYQLRSRCESGMLNSAEYNGGARSRCESPMLNSLEHNFEAKSLCESAISNSANLTNKIKSPLENEPASLTQSDGKANNFYENKTINYVESDRLNNQKNEIPNSEKQSGKTHISPKPQINPPSLHYAELKTLVPKNDKFLYENLIMQCDMFGVRRVENFSVDEFTDENSKIFLDDKEIKVIETPGHSKGSTCYLIEDNLIAGDTLFYEEIGRCDLPTGSFSDITRSIKEKLFNLNDNIKVFAGHGDNTTIGHEKEYNAYFGKKAIY